MLKLAELQQGSLLRCTVALIFAGSLAACGGGGGGGSGGGGGGFGGVVVAEPAVAPLSLALTRVGPEAIAVDWSDDPFVDTFLVRRNGFALATVTTTSLVDASVFINETYCYQVEGHDTRGRLVAASSTGCVTILP